MKLAPELPSHENFVLHWKTVTNYFIESTGNSGPFYMSNVHHREFKQASFLQHGCQHEQHECETSLTGVIDFTQEWLTSSLAIRNDLIHFWLGPMLSLTLLV